MKKSTVTLVATAALAALLLTGCAEAAGFNGLRQQATPAASETTTPEDAVDVAPQATAQGAGTSGFLFRRGHIGAVEPLEDGGHLGPGGGAGGV